MLQRKKRNKQERRKLKGVSACPVKPSKFPLNNAAILTICRSIEKKRQTGLPYKPVRHLCRLLTLVIGCPTEDSVYLWERL